MQPEYPDIDVRFGSEAVIEAASYAAAGFLLTPSYLIALSRLSFTWIHVVTTAHSL
jgi:hypothetical protein